MQENWHSWIPNLTGEIKFHYLSDTLEHHDGKVSIIQHKNNNDNTKCFLIPDVNYSDNLDDVRKGINRDIIVMMKNVENDGITSIVGSFKEFAPSSSDIVQWFESDGGKLFGRSDCVTHATFELALDGRINIKFEKYPERNGNISEDGNIPQITYRAIKGIMHKDVFHDVEEDTIIGVFKEKTSLKSVDSNFKKEILESLQDSLKDLERGLKDNLHDYDKKRDFYNIVLTRMEGILLYMKSFCYIYEIDISTNYTVLKSINIVDSAKKMLHEKEKWYEAAEINKDIKIVGITAFISGSILISNLLSSKDPIQIEHYVPTIGFLGISIAFLVYYLLDRRIIRRISFYRHMKKSTDGFIDSILRYDASNKKIKFRFLKIVAWVLILLSVALFYSNFNVQNPTNKNESNTTTTQHPVINQDDNKSNANELNSSADLVQTSKIEVNATNSTVLIQQGDGNSAVIEARTKINKLISLLEEDNSTAYQTMAQKGKEIAIELKGNDKEPKQSIIEWLKKITIIDKASSIITERATELIEYLNANL